MGFFSSNTEERILGNCLYCGKPMIGKVDKDSGKIEKKPDGTTKDGKGFICKECYEARDLMSYDVENKNLPDLLDFKKKKNFADPYSFTPTHKIHHLGKSISPRKKLMYLEVDEANEMINIPYYKIGFFSDDMFDVVYRYEDQLMRLVRYWFIRI